MGLISALGGGRIAGLGPAQDPHGRTVRRGSSGKTSNAKVIREVQQAARASKGKRTSR